MKEIILSCLLALFAVSPLCSQNAGSKKKTANEKKQKVEETATKIIADSEGEDLAALKKDIEALKAKIDTLTRQYNGLNDKLHETDSLLADEKGKFQKLGMKDKVDDLNKKKKDLSTRLYKVTDSLKSDYGKKLDELSHKNSANADSISVLRERIGAYEAFRNLWMVEFADSIVGSFTSQRYSAVDMSEAENLLLKYNKLAEDNGNVEAARDTLEHFFNECRLYVKGTEAVNAPYEHNRVNDLIVPMQTMRDAAPDGDKKEDLRNVARMLYNYEVTVEIFEEIVEEVNAAVKGKEDHAKAYGAVKKILERQVDDGVVEEIEDIPWLKTQYGVYCKSLENNCLKPVKLQLRKK